ncbi:N-succinyldiaminopimelate aminotransferase [Jatrophihabitans sp. GAS493]|uniref:pyridoxal phosphate-dependent aminotransferase n=1 Tax=Jatrophihabitans sp. GAS493 TaxID=1907575 RepID=UPI000BC04545|nr:pyridoxal phosphate-dependent aminotransferase [Jatrophihabitans sp. GAS493]SOD75125.1 N-succinyldiaminopimelate aminotransferase [Jatrophihabitans sp. GAS493]
MTGSGPLVERMSSFGTTIFAEMSALALRTGSINLGQGFPDTDGPSEVLQAAVDAINAGQNQYPPGIGVPALRQAIAAHQLRFYGQSVDPDTEVLVTAGATEAIAASILALVEPGDEVVMFEPYYDSYAACVALAGGRRRVVTLHRDGQRWIFDPAELRAAITSKTRLILLNTPHNPTGKVFSRSELSTIAAVACEYDLLVVADEVYEHLTFDGLPHVPIATLPDMAERTVTISSAGKTFSVTGWKIGWVVSTAELVTAVKTVKQFLTYVSGAPFQPAVAHGLALPDATYGEVARNLQQQRDLLCDGLTKLGLDVIRPQATYFATVDIGADALQFCRELPEKHGVVAIPSRVFYDTDAGSRYVRFAFCKRPDVLVRAIERLSGPWESNETAGRIS